MKKEATLDRHPPLAVYFYVALIFASSFLTLFSLHRTFYSVLHDFSVPQILIAALTGLLNLSWFELAYAIGGGLKSVQLFLAIPTVGAVAGLISCLPSFLHKRFAHKIILSYGAFCLILGILSLGVLMWRYVRGIQDYWRLVATLGFLVLHACWLVYMRGWSKHL